MYAQALKMLEADRKAQADAGRREYVALARSARREAVEDCVPAVANTAPRVKAFKPLERAAAPVARRLKRKLNRAERQARRAMR